MQKAMRAIAGCLVICVPAGLTWLLVRIFLDASLTSSIPSYAGQYNDAFFYWRQIGTFAAVGFDGGYYTFNEAPALVTFSHFSTWGPAFPMIYGMLGRVFGWLLYTGPLFNMLFVTGALAVFVIVIRPTLPQLVAICIVLATYWPLLLFLPTTMQESLHHAFAIILAALFYVMLTRKNTRIAPIALLFIVSISVVRPTWSFTLLPLFLLCGFRLWSSALLSGTLVVLIFVVASGLMAPYDNFARTLLRSSSFQLFLSELKAHAGANISKINDGSPIFIVVRAQLMVVLASCFLLSKREALFHLTNLIPILVFVVLFYELDFGRDRLLASHVLLAVLILTTMGRYQIVTTLVALNVVFLPTFLTEYKNTWLPLFHFDQRSIKEFEALTRSVVLYDDQTSNPWCNTLLIQLDHSYTFPPELLAIHRGIGISYVIDDSLGQTVPKSKYMLLTRPLASPQNYRLLAKTRIGNIVANLDADCEQ